METEISAYEQLRLANIAKNKEFLEGLGLSPKAKPSTGHKKQNQKRKAPQQPSEESVQPTRRSQRVAELPVVAYQDVSSILLLFFSRIIVSSLSSFVVSSQPSLFVGSLYSSKAIFKDSDKVSDKVETLMGTFIDNDDEKKDRKYKVAESDSCIDVKRTQGNFSRNTNCRYNMFLKADNICKPVDEYGKAAVMQMSNGGELLSVCMSV